MGRLAGPTGAGRRQLTRWAFALDAIPSAIDECVALVLSPDIVFRLPLLRGRALAEAAAGGGRSIQRRQVLAALVARLGLPVEGTGLTSDLDGVRHLAGTALYASVAERSGWVAAVVATTPVGIDLECRAEAQASAAALLAGIDIVDPAAWHGLAGVWAAREATLKAMGRDLTRDPVGWRFAAGVVAPAGGSPHRVDLVGLPGIVAAIAYVGG